MSKGLEALERIAKGYIDTDDIETISNELKVLEILKNKQVDIELFMECDTWEEYVIRCENHADMSRPIYDLLMEVLS